MTDYNASDTRAIRKAEKAAKQAEAQRREITLKLMSDPAGRNWMLELLELCSIFATTYTGNALQSSFLEGRRDIGLRLLNDVVNFAPDQYIQMMREASDRNQSNGRRTDSSPDQHSGSTESGRDLNGSVLSEYDPADRDEAGGEDAPN